MQFLLFTLYAPLGSFGEVAVGERRPSWARPGRSAIFGLIAAARGIDRADSRSHIEMERNLQYAVRTDATGKPLLDYHTAQSPKARKGVTFATRKDELDASDLHTILSSREWRSNTFFTVVIWPRSTDLVDLEEIRDRLRFPRFVLYQGRKAGVFGLPFNPELVEAEDLMGAFKKRKPNAAETCVLKQIGADLDNPKEIAYDADASCVPVSGTRRTERRRDRVVDRVRWQFTDRLEQIQSESQE